MLDLVQKNIEAGLLRSNKQLEDLQDRLDKASEGSEGEVRLENELISRKTKTVNNT